MHRSVLAWVPAVLPAGEVAGARVLEVGSYNVNGSIRPLIEAHRPETYVGVDQTEGPNVDQVVSVADLVDTFGAETFDLVISTEMLEHVGDWRQAVTQMVTVCRHGGVIVVTTRSKGFPYHPYPEDNWRFSVNQMRDIAATAGLEIMDLRSDPQVPGVFCKARRVAPCGSLDEIEVGTP